MLEAKNLHREYKTKKGPIVKALDDVSIKFEEKGMVFILGKSGSGKSTLLNVLGGLDKYDSGEVIVKGKSSKDFSQADFDSYRNTYIGFIFQDYNILEEFTISKNIGLALELQGKKADKNVINDLMKQVDLEGYGSRKPNTLSGGQRQRVAIARALVKNPEIIMADEPTGALDSNTGRQVLDTLKHLSKTKLVLIVSHDREFAEYYGDRIVELADGKIISDVQKYKSAPKESNGIEIVDDKIMTIRKGTKLDAARSSEISKFIGKHDNDVIVSVDDKANKEFKKFAMIDDEGNKESFKNTENLDIKDYDPKKFKLIRSKLPGIDSFKMGASGLKTKPIRLFFTIILSAVAFCLFGLADTMGSYNKVDNTIKSIIDSKVDYASITKSVEAGGSDYSYFQNTKMSKKDFEKLNAELKDFNFIPVFGLSEWSNTTSFSSNIFDSEGISNYNSLYSDQLYGFVEITETTKNNFGTIVAGRIPNSDSEIMITKYVYDVFKKGSYKDNGTTTKVEINSYENLIGKKIYIDWETELAIVGIIDTNIDMTRYSKMEEPNFGGGLEDYMISSEWESLLQNSYHALGYLNAGYFNNNVNSEGPFSSITNSINVLVNPVKPSSDGYGNSIQHLADYSSTLNNEIKWIGDSKTSLSENEIIVSYNMLSNSSGDYSIQFSINGNQYTLSNILNGKQSIFDTEFKNLLSSTSGLETYVMDYNSLINYYNAFNTSDTNFEDSIDDSYTYDASRNKWVEENNYGSISLTEEQKNILNNFLENFSCSNCIDVNSLVSSNFNSSLNTTYDARLVQDGLDSSTYSFSSYKNDIISYLKYEHWNLNFHSYTLSPLSQEEINIINNIKEEILENILPLMYTTKAWLKYYHPNNYDVDYHKNPREVSIVGIYLGDVANDNSSSNGGIISSAIYDEFSSTLGGVYNFAISAMDYNNQDSVRKIVEFNYKEGEIKYDLNNPVMSGIVQINDMIENLASVFLYIGIGFAVFAALLLLNFITISISYKKREIGVLRAIGARGADVFRIFFNEAFIIAFINFVVAFAGCAATCMFLNKTFREDYGLLITFLNVGVRQVILMFAVSVVVAFLASFLPVRGIARKKPIDAIRNS